MISSWKKEKGLHSKMEQFIPDNGMATTDMAKVRKFGLTAPGMKVLGSAMWLRASVNSCTPMETFTKANGPMIKPTEREDIFTLMVPNMMANGKMTFSMAKELNVGRMALSTKASTPEE